MKVKKKGISRMCLVKAFDSLFRPLDTEYIDKEYKNFSN